MNVMKGVYLGNMNECHERSISMNVMKGVYLGNMNECHERSISWEHE